MRLYLYVNVLEELINIYVSEWLGVQIVFIYTIVRPLGVKKFMLKYANGPLKVLSYQGENT